MALSGGSSWASLPPTSLSSRRQQHMDIQLGTWRMIGCCKTKVDLFGGVNWSTTASAIQVPLRSIFLKKQLPLLAYASSDGISSDSELDDDVVEEENEERTKGEDSVEGNLGMSTDGTDGKPGFVSFSGRPYQTFDETPAPDLEQKRSNLYWFLGPTVLVASFIFPSLYMRRLTLMVFEDSLLTDFLILFFTEALFYGGVAIFVLVIDHIWKPVSLKISKKNYHPKHQFGLRISSVAILVLSLVIPLVTMGIVWPWTGPAASATLAPYLVGLLVQFAFEQYARHRKSRAWPVIPVIFQVYRLHQLNRAAQLVTALSFSVRGAETTSQTVAINTSLGTLLNVLQLLGIISVWSLASFLMRFLPGPPTSDP